METEFPTLGPLPARRRRIRTRDAVIVATCLFGALAWNAGAPHIACDALSHISESAGANRCALYFAQQADYFRPRSWCGTCEWQFGREYRARIARIEMKLK